MTGLSTSSDIWSVGSTAVELLTGKPPYFDMPIMPAMYRIVSDEHPPLPPGISPLCRDFLLQCFNKDPHTRSSASTLVKHRWITKHARPQDTRPTVGSPLVSRPVLDSESELTSDDDSGDIGDLASRLRQTAQPPKTHLQSIAPPDMSRLTRMAEEDEDE
ncbi:hypothetical protein KIPB_012902, partial [Kipferlia bialata]|eukprot:g12902.t1